MHSLSLIHHHPSPEVRAAAIRLLDALTTWERDTGQPNIVIIKDGTGTQVRTLSGSPLPEDLCDNHALESFENLARDLNPG